MQPFSDKTTVAVPADQQHAERLAGVLDHYMRELENGGIPPDLDALVAAHPDLADELRSYADSLKLLHQMTAGLKPTPGRVHAAPAPMTAKRLGDYDIVREIGRGGMGIVYYARQLSLNRQVALKVLPFAAMLDDKQIARFRNEAQAAAQLHHPNIVPVHAVGQERGVHYFAMQYVPGQSLEAALAELRREGALPSQPSPSGGGKGEGEAAARPGTHASPRPGPLPRGEGVARQSESQRLADTLPFAAFSTKASTRSRGYCQSVARLMIQAAEAIQHAHEYGVIHRDVKPSNLLLDRAGKLWVTDFGLARVQSDSGVTMTGDVVGTLRYMSPEQAAGATAMIDGRTDVYALGATMYELLTLRPAHSGENRQVVLRQIETREPVAPRAINPAIPLDLETITLRAMSKAREERYPTAQALADDLRLFLEGKPTVARRPTLLDRAGKWTLRHRRAVAAAAGVLAALAVVSATAAVLIAREKSRTEAALEEARQSLTERDEAARLAGEVIDQFGSGLASELAALPGIEPLRRRLLGETLAYYRRLIEQSAGEPRWQRQLADASFKAAAIAASLGDRGEAIALCRQASDEFDALVRRDPSSEDLQLSRAKCRRSLGLLLAGGGDVDAALGEYAGAIDQLRPLAGRRTASPDAVRELAGVYSSLGLLLAESGRRDAARGALETAIELLGPLTRRRPDDLPLKHDLALCYNSLGYVERERDAARAAALCRQAIELLEAVATQQDAATFRADLALCCNNLGAILGQLQSWNDAAEAYRRAIALQEELARQAPAVVAYRRDLAVSWNNLGDALAAQGDDAAATAALADAQRIIERLVEDAPDDPSFRSLLGAVLNNRAMRLEEAGEVEAALAVYEDGAREQRAALDRAPQIAVYREALSKLYFNYGRALRTAGRPAAAGDAALARRALWAGDGRRLAQAAVELALAAALARQQPGADAAALADELESHAAETLRAAQAAGDDLSALQNEAVFQTLHDPSIWSTIMPGGTAGD